MITFRPLTAQEIPLWHADELSEAFIPQERKPLPNILHMIADGRYEVWGLFEADRLLGYAALWTHPRIPLVLLDYLGVTRSRRSEGLGSRILAHLGAQGRPLVTEAEYRFLCPQRLHTRLSDGHLRHGVAGAVAAH